MKTLDDLRDCIQTDLLDFCGDDEAFVRFDDTRTRLDVILQIVADRVDAFTG